MEHFLLTFPVNYQNVYDHQSSQGGDMLQELYDISAEWSCGVTWQIKYISPPVEDVSTPPH